MHRRFVIVGSGPIGATFARTILEADADAEVLMLELGPQLTERPGMNVKNVGDPVLRDAARTASQGPQRHGGIAALAGHIVQEGTITARHGTHLIDHGGDGSGSAQSFPAAAASTCVGGQGAHWTCATPAPEYSERIDFIENEEWQGLLLEAERLLHVTHTAFSDSQISAAIRYRLAQTVAASLPEGRGPAVLPVAGDEQPDGTMYWAGSDTVLGPLLDADGTFAGRFELRPETLVRRVLHRDERVVGVLAEETRSGEKYEVAADVVILAADALRTPQLMWASGIRPPALGRYLTEHPLIFSAIGLSPGVMAELSTLFGIEAEIAERTGRKADPIAAMSRIPFSEPEHPFSAVFTYTDVAPIPLPEESPWCDSRWGYLTAGYGLRKFPRWEDAVTFSDAESDHVGMPRITIDYALTEREEQESALALKYLERVAAALGEFLPGGEPRLLPAGSSLHYQGTVRAGVTDDGTSVCDPYSRVWGVEGLIVGGNGVIPTATSVNPTLTSVALAVRAARRLVDA